MSHHRLLQLTLVLAAVWGASWLSTRPSGAQARRPASAGLSEAERQSAFTIAESQLTQNPRFQAQFKGARGVGGIVPTRVQLLAGGAARQQRRAQVQFYQYDGDVTLIGTVDLETKKLIGEPQAIKHFPTPLHTLEVDRAATLAAAQSREVRALQKEFGDKLVVEAHLNVPGNEGDPNFGSRVVDLLYRVGPRYFSIRNTVNLTKQTVQINRGGPQGGH